MLARVRKHENNAESKEEKTAFHGYARLAGRTVNFNDYGMYGVFSTNSRTPEA